MNHLAPDERETVVITPALKVSLLDLLAERARRLAVEARDAEAKAFVRLRDHAVAPVAKRKGWGALLWLAGAALARVLWFSVLAPIRTLKLLLETGALLLLPLTAFVGVAAPFIAPMVSRQWSDVIEISVTEPVIALLTGVAFGFFCYTMLWRTDRLLQSPEFWPSLTTDRTGSQAHDEDPFWRRHTRVLWMLTVLVIGKSVLLLASWTYSHDKLLHPNFAALSLFAISYTVCYCGMSLNYAKKSIYPDPAEEQGEGEEQKQEGQNAREAAKPWHLRFYHKYRLGQGALILFVGLSVVSVYVHGPWVESLFSRLLLVSFAITGICAILALGELVFQLRKRFNSIAAPLLAALFFVTLFPQSILGLSGKALVDNREVDSLEIRRSEGEQPLQRRLREIKGPAIVVAAEGGGIHAAYRVARILSHLDRRTDGALYSHLAAISSVSGGSVGSVIYLGAREGVTRKFGEKAGIRKLDASVDDLLACNLLSPVLTRLLFSEWLAAILPRWQRLDRARGLEEAIKDSVLKLDGGAREPAYEVLSRGMHEYAQDPRHPLLFMNSLSTQRGDRFVLCDQELGLDIDPKTGKVVHAASDSTIKLKLVRTYAEVSGDRDLSLATAACLSSRFPAVLPSGRIRIEGPEGRPDYERLIDGGIADNTGLSTAVDIIRKIRAYDPGRKILLIQIGNHGSTSGPTPEDKNPVRDPLFADLLSFPSGAAKALYDKNGPTRAEQRDFEKVYGYTRYPIIWDGDKIDAPLGWVLHPTRIRAISYQIGIAAEPPRESRLNTPDASAWALRKSNVAQLDHIVKRIGTAGSVASP